MVSIEPAQRHHFAEVLAWLMTEEEQGGAGFYCNREIIESSFASSQGLCAITDGKIVGFAVYQMFTDGGHVQIIEVEPSTRRQGLGSKLLLSAIDILRGLGAKYIQVQCTSAEGDALCRHHGFEDYVDPRNRRKWGNPLLRLYLSEWRPAPPNPWV